VEKARSAIVVAGWVIISLLLLSVLTGRNHRKTSKPIIIVHSKIKKFEQIPLGVPSNKIKTVVTKVLDGDTVEIDGGERVRLIGIDAPEKYEPYFKEARDKLKELVDKKEIVLEKDATDKDSYGRLLRYIWLGNLLVNAEMVRQGWAVSQTYLPNVKYQEQILKASIEATIKKRRLWKPIKDEKCPYVASRLQKPFHYLSCSQASKILEKNREYFKTRKEAIKAGHRPCKFCTP